MSPRSSRTTSAHGIIRVNRAHTGGVSHGEGGVHRPGSCVLVAARVATRRTIVRSADPLGIGALGWVAGQVVMWFAPQRVGLRRNPRGDLNDRQGSDQSAQEPR